MKSNDLRKISTLKSRTSIGKYKRSKKKRESSLSSSRMEAAFLKTQITRKTLAVMEVTVDEVVVMAQGMGKIKTTKVCNSNFRSQLHLQRHSTDSLNTCPSKGTTTTTCINKIKQIITDC